MIEHRERGDKKWRMRSCGGGGLTEFGGAGALGSCTAWGQLCSLVTGDNVFLLLLKLTPVGFL